MATLSQWIEGARPRTLPAAVSPILVGTGAAYQTGHVVWAYAVLALVVALSLQVGVNFANDYSDGIRGTDEVRVGPVRLVGQRLAEPRSVKIAAFACFFFAGLMGLALVGLSQLWVMIPIGAAAIVAAWYYTGGSRPYGYLGLGELFVFVFFGLVATLGTMATMTPPTAAGWWGAIGVGALASAILVANNLRDIPTDREHGKLTLAVRMGESGTRAFYVALVAVAFVMTGLASLTSPWALLSLLAAPLVVRPMQAVVGRATGPGLIPALAGTGQFQLAWSLLLAVGLALGRA
ncbi:MULTISPECIES: 1,4-dihydroxy-2-naphthoate polyprenyltransferase [unclassified Terrabacter]|uniref:1,4-dihydroxy-2-naphthoate polyprenyltransferase n=1 Tax=unclassified Terrabacter TaxID=2630222 RepID=UPI0006F48B96|nr:MULTISPECIES: 1,4-dihydroxy-2-naphthoate polyprenyltransferase [unclassified Terrabacter]KRB43695.1 1,4-dihydroxy-2-naphthoate octaprenyltransferase [Terrabacter sp. Root181]KRF46951.1 1,4-dihydroxy-2-naphthoate octaprenyltransferase [Terrabacter sp. Soil810]